MKFLFLIIFISINSFSKVELSLFFSGLSVKQGEVVEVPYRVVAKESFNESDLVGKKIAGSIFISELSFNKAKVIVFKKPYSEKISDSILGEEIFIDLHDLTFNEVKIQDKYLYEEFEVKNNESSFLVLYIFGILVFILCFYLLIKFRKKRQKLKNEKEAIQTLKNKIINAKTLDDIISVYLNKSVFLGTFPSIEEPYLKFESVLNKYQFKPEISEVEKIEIQEAYRKFIRAVEGALNGI